MPSPRRKPHCTRCNLPMAGHRRPNGTPICPSMPTPLGTPGPQGYVREATDEDAHTAIDDADAEDVKPARAYYKSVRTLADVPYPPDGRYHYRNPNWGTSTVLDLAPALADTASGACAQNGHLYEEDGEEESTGPTVLNGHTPKRHLPGKKMDQHSPHRSRLVSDPKRQQLLYAYQQQQQQLQALEFPPTTAPCSAIDPDATPALEDESISVRMLRTMTASAAVLRALIGNGTPPGAGLYTTTRSALSAAERAARRQGYHTGVMEKPRAHPAPARRLAAESTVWMVVGTEKEAVDHLLDLQLEHTTSGKDARAAPGAIGLLQEPYNLGTPRGLIFSQLVMAGVVGGLFVVVALAYWF